MKLRREFRIGGLLGCGPTVGHGRRFALTVALAWLGIVAGVPRAVVLAQDSGKGATGGGDASATSAAAVVPSDDDGAPDGKAVHPLAERQAIIRDRVERLEDRLFRLSRALRESDPEKADKLVEALGTARRFEIRRRIEAIILSLENDRYSDAADQQQAVAADLQFVLKYLLEEPDNLDQHKEDIARLAQLREALKSIVEEQRREKAAAESAKAAEARAEVLEKAAETARRLLDRQQDLASETDRAEPAVKKAAEAQVEVRGETEALAATLREGAGDDTAGEDDGGAAMKAAAAELDDAAGAMKSAEAKLGRGEAREAKSDQSRAVEELREAAEELADEARRQREKPDLDKQAAEQRETAQKTKRVAEGMKGCKGGKNGGGGKDKGAKGGGDSDDKKPAGPPGPRPRDVEGAVPHQEGAADELEKGEFDKALDEQGKALEKLEQAQDEVEDALDQLRKEQQEEALAALETRFRAMLARQIDVSKATDHLSELGKEHWTRMDQLRLAEVSQDQRQVGDQAEEALTILVEDGTTAVFPEIVGQVRDDAIQAADGLAAADTGEHVRAIQGEIEQTLRDLIEAVEKQQDENDFGGSGGGGGGGRCRSLLPGSAELKLLRSCQLRVNQATRLLAEVRAGPDAAGEQIAARLRKLCERQAAVADMARAMDEQMRKGQ